MTFIYAMSDMHGDMEAFDQALSVVDLSDPSNRLILCGDYFLPPLDEDETMVKAIMRLQDEHPGQVIALKGNHELIYLENNASVPRGVNHALDWVRELPYFHKTDTQIFVHAGVDEDAGEYWEWGTEDAYFCEKFPWTTGPFLKDVIAGHTSTATISGDPTFHGVYWDGESHYYLDGAVHETHRIPVLKYDIEHKRYTAIAFDDEGESEEYELEPPLNPLGAPDDDFYPY